MQAREVVFQHLLDGKIQYRVPLFQRTYDWKREQWEQLWDDILELYSLESSQNHFIGAVVSQPLAHAPEQASKNLLIDGQQRLTTLMLLLTAIRTYAAKDETANPGLADEIVQTCLINQFVPNDKDRLKLQPTKADAPTFEKAIDEQVARGRSRIAQALRFFLGAIADGDLDDEKFDLRKLKMCITHRLDLVSITLDPTDSPHRIFESLNNTGMRLGASDLIRNYLFMHIPDEVQQEDAYEKVWLPMQKSVARYLDEFFWRYLMMRGVLVRRDEIFDRIKIELGTPTPQDAIDAIERYSRFASYYRTLGQWEEDVVAGPFDDQAGRLNTWELDVAYPFLMQAKDWVESGKSAEPDLVVVMKMIESFVIRRTVCGIPTNRLRRLFSRMSLEVDPTDIVATSRQYLLKNEWPSDDQFQEEFVRFRLYVNARGDRGKLVLASLEGSFGNKEAPEISDQITIEHIMPKTLSPEWSQALGPNARDIHVRWLDTPGNLTLTGYNPELSNKPFLEKRELLGAKTNFALSKMLLDRDQWDDEAIEQRGRVLAERAVSIWPR